MKLSEIEAVARVDAFEKKANFTDEVRYGGERLYSGRQMQEYAKECVREAYKEIVKNSYVSDGRVEQAGLNEIINKVFEEDTKND